MKGRIISDLSRRHDRGVHGHDGDGQVRVRGGERDADLPTQAVPDYDRILEPEPGAYPREVVGETLDSVLLLGRVALAVPAQVHRHYPMVIAKVLELGREVSMVTR